MNFFTLTRMTLLSSVLIVSAQLQASESIFDYNVYTKENLVYVKSDIQGYVATGDKAYLRSFNILEELRTTERPYSLVSGSTVYLANGDVYNAGVLTLGNADIQNGYIEGDVVANGDILMSRRNTSLAGRKLPYSRNRVNFTEYNQTLDAASRYFSALKENVQVGTREVNNSQYLNLKADNDNGQLKNVFYLNKLESNLVIDAAGDPREYFVINVAANYNSLKYLDIKLLGGAEPSRILFNFYAAQTVELHASGASSLSNREMGLGIPGTILAPQADVFFYEGLLTGSLYAKNLYGFTPRSEKEIRYYMDSFPYRSLNGEWPSGQINNGQFICLQNAKPGDTSFGNCRDGNDTPYY